MDKRTKFSVKQKLSALRSILAGRDSCASAAKKIGSKGNTVQRWLIVYKKYGVAGLRMRPGVYSGDFKVLVVRYLLKNRLSLAQTAIYFGIPNDSVVYCWLKIYQCSGVSGLLSQTKGRKKTVMPRKTEKKIRKTNSISAESAEDIAALQKEVEYLRAENAFLKKLEALIQQEKPIKAQSKGQKPSRN